MQKIKWIDWEDYVLQGTTFLSWFSEKVFQVPPPPTLDVDVNSLLEVIDHSFALFMWDGLDLVLNCAFQVSDRLRAILIDSVLEKTPQMEVKGVQIGGMGSPVIFTSSADYSVTEACFYPWEGHIWTVRRWPILLQPLNSSLCPSLAKWCPEL